MLNFSIKKVGEKFVGTMTGGTPNGSYTMQTKIAPPVINDWIYAGSYEANYLGTVVTYEFNLPNPNSEYPYLFRFKDDLTGAVSNVITIYTNGNINGGSWSLGIMVAIVAIIAVIIGMFVIKKKVK